MNDLKVTDLTKTLAVVRVYGAIRGAWQQWVGDRA